MSLALLALLGGFSTSAMAGEYKVYSLFLADELEVGAPDPDLPVAWDALARIGGDVHRFWVKTEGDYAATTGEADVEVQLLYSRLIAPFWEFQAGIRTDISSETGPREFLVVGLEGLAPYWFEIEPTLFVTHEGQVSARLAASHDVFLTQRMIAQPSFEFNVNGQAVPAVAQGAGPTDLSLGVRVRYEIKREFAPYAGVEWEQRFLDTAVLAQAAGGSVSTTRAVGGVRLWF